MKEGKTCNINNLYFRFVRFALGMYEGKEFLSGEALDDFDWNAFYSFCKKQTLLGVVFEGIQRLPKDFAPHQNLLLNWFGVSRRIQIGNVQANEATSYIYNKVKDVGLRCSILKGQGNALMYPNPHSRTPGDVDVWVNANKEDIRRLAQLLVKDNGNVGDESINHVGLNVNGIAVELHSTPAIMNNPLYNYRMQKWLRRNVDSQCSNIVSLPDNAGSVAVPTLGFNVVYLLYHLYHHYFYEGVGLRQVVDYYFVVMKWHTDLTNLTDKVAMQNELKHLGLWSFCGAVMYVLREVLGMPEERMIAPMDEKRGRLLLNEILSGGNFGHYDERFSFGRGAVGHNLQRLYRDLRLVRYYPAEALSEPIFRIWHFFWRLKNNGSK